MKHKNAEVLHAYVDGKTCEYWSNDSNKWQVIHLLETFDWADKVRIKLEPKKDWIEERTLFWNKCVNFVAYDSMGSEWLKDGKHYTKLGNFKLTFDGETREVKLVELIK